jgi:hypothetical protein
LRRINSDTFTIIVYAILAYDRQLKKVYCQISIYWRTDSNGYSHRPMEFEQIDCLAGWERECSVRKAAADCPITNSAQGNGWQVAALG